MNVDKIGQQKGVTPAQTRQVTPGSDQVQNPQARANTRVKRDEVQISKEAQELARAMKAVQDAPDVRETKVAELKKQVDAGTYSVPRDALISKILGMGGQ